MQLFPSLDEFQALAADAGVVPVWREFLFDVDTAVTAYAKLVEPPFGFLLESVVGGERWARYTFLGTKPSGAWRLRNSQVSWWTPEEGWKDIPAEDPLADLDARLRARRPAEVPGLPLLWGGAVGYFGYDVVRQIERLPNYQGGRDHLRRGRGWPAGHCVRLRLRPGGRHAILTICGCLAAAALDKCRTRLRE